MDFGFYYRPDENRVLFHYRPDDPAASPCCYDTVVSESRIVDYIGIGRGQLPQKEYFGRWRTFPDTCDCPARRPSRSGLAPLLRRGRVRGRLPVQRHPARALLGRLDVRGPDAGAVRARGDAGRRTAGARTTRSRSHAQIFHGMTEAGYGYWGFSPANKPEGDYGAWGVDGAGMDPNGMPSNEDNTLVDHGFAGCPDRPAQPDPPQSAYTNGVVTPHAAFLALRYAPQRTRRERGAGSHGTSPASTGSGGSATASTCRRGGLGRLPVARPGDDHGRARQRARRRRAAPRVRRPRDGTRTPAGDRH